MKILYFVPEGLLPRKSHGIVSGHAQIPLYMAKLLYEAGHEVEVVTERPGPNDTWSLPWDLDRHIGVHFLPRRPGAGGVAPPRVGHCAQVASVIGQIWGLRRLAAAGNYDILHCHGFERAAMLVGGVGLWGRSTRIAFSAYAPPGRHRWLNRCLIRTARMVTTGTAFVQQAWRGVGAPMVLLRHGVIRDFADEPGYRPDSARHRVLYWRDLTHQNGADIAVKVFANLARRYPNVSFDFAVRPHPRHMYDVEAMVDQLPNVFMHTVPYSDGMSLARLISEAIVAVFPFRELSIHPQLAILETLAAGVPVVATHAGSTDEVVTDGKSGFLVQASNDSQLYAAVKRFLVNPQDAALMGAWGRRDISRRFCWDRCLHALMQGYETLLTGERFSMSLQRTVDI